MSAFTMRLPDVGEGVAEAELVEWLVSVGDVVTPDSPIAEVLTDKATVEISAPVSGTVTALHGAPGDVLAVGADLVEFETEARGPAGDVASPPTDDVLPAPEPPPSVDSPAVEPPTPSPRRSIAAPAVRARAKRIGVDLADVRGTGPSGRVVHDDLDRLARRGAPGTPSSAGSTGSGGSAHPVRGVRRRIAERLTAAWTEIPHITYVESVDVTELERLRSELNRADAGGQRLTLLPFLATAIVVAVRDQPTINAHYDHAGETLTVFDEVHLGIATQTDDGLRVPVVRDAGSLGLRGLADEIARLSEAARSGTASRAELTGSTITITSLGALGGIVTTPILNPPEVAIVGVNKIETRPVWQDGAFVPRRMMNLSSSFDHRMVDGWDAASFVRRLATLLESPALLFLDDR